MVISSIVSISSLNGQYNCRSFCTSALIDDQPHKTYSDNMLRCSLSIVPDVISSTVMQSCMSMHDSMVFMVTFIPSIFSPVFVSWLCLDSQSTMNSCGLGLYSNLMLYWWMYSNNLCSLCDKLASFFEDCHQQFVVCYYADITGKAAVMEVF